MSKKGKPWNAKKTKKSKIQPWNAGSTTLAKAEAAAEASLERYGQAMTDVHAVVEKMDAPTRRQALRKAQLGYLELTNPNAARIWKQAHASEL